MSILYLLSVFGLVDLSLTLNLPLNSSPSSLSLRDPCSTGSPNNLTVLSLDDYPHLPFLTRVYNDKIYLKLSKGGLELSPEHKTEVINDLRYIRIETNESGSAEDLMYGPQFYGWLEVWWSLPDWEVDHGITRAQALNVITTVCSLVNACGPEEIQSAQIFSSSDSPNNLLGGFQMKFLTEMMKSNSTRR